METLKMFGGFDPSLMAGGGGGASRFPRGFKPFVKCRLCGKSWKGKDNFFTHLVSTHFKYLWAKEVPRQADMFHCHVPGCTYQSKYRYNFLFHLAGKHKQLKAKFAFPEPQRSSRVVVEFDDVTAGYDGEVVLTLPASVRGTHRVRIEAMLDGKPVGTASTVYAVTARDPEMDEVAPDRAFLQKLAHRSGGRMHGAG